MNNLTNININRLPAEILELIFKKLNLQDKKLNCSLVCRLWRDIIKNLKEDCLVVSDRICVNEIWFHKNTSVSILNQVYPFNYDFLPESQIQTTFVRLKRLFLYFGLFEDELDFALTINKFKHLEHLELKFVNIKNESNLILPNLKILTLSTIASYQKLKLSTPELRYLKGNFHNVEYEFENVDKLIFLEVDECKPIIERFKNLEYLISKKFSKIQIGTLLSLPKLKEVHNNGFNCLFGFQDLILFGELYQRKKDLQWNNLNLFICGISYEMIKKDPFPIFGPNLTMFYSEYFAHLVDVVHWEERFYFNKFNFNDNWKLLNDVTTKFPNIKHVFGEKFKNEEMFLMFLKNCKHLDKLNLSLPFKNEDSYNKMVAYCPTITQLEIGVTGSKCQFIDLRFILNFKYLCFFSINQEADLNVVRDAFNKLKYMKFFKFDFDNLDERQLCFVTVQKRKDWKLEFKGISEKFETLDRLLDFYELKKCEDESFYL